MPSSSTISSARVTESMRFALGSALRGSRVESRTTGLSVSAVQSRVRRLEARGVVTGYSARVDPEAFGHMLSAFVAITPLDPSQPDDAPARLEHVAEIEACYSVAGEESYVLFVRVESPRDLETLLQQIRTAANVRTRSTIILNTFYSDRVYVPE